MICASSAWSRDERENGFGNVAGGFFGGYLVRRLKSEGFFVRGVDLKFPQFSESNADDLICSLAARAARTSSALSLQR